MVWRSKVRGGPAVFGKDVGEGGREGRREGRREGVPCHPGHS